VAVDKPLVAETALVCFHESAIHGTGGFANVDIVAGTRAIEYVGERITKAESLCRCESNNKYIFSLDETYNLDGNVPWNPARFLNHSCDPNCEAKPDGGCIWIVARRDIRAGFRRQHREGRWMIAMTLAPNACDRHEWRTMQGKPMLGLRIFLAGEFEEG